MVNTQYDLVLANARKDGDQAAVKELEAKRPDPANAQEYFSFSGKYHVRSLWPQPDQAWLQHLRSQLPELQANNPEQSKYLEEGMEFQGEHVLPDQLATNLPKTACAIETAYFVIQGQDDIVTPTQAAMDYFKCVKAPKKELVLIPNAGHFAFMTASKEFLDVLTLKVRPVALARGA
jgi:pimeloyl-ACP methyl ester carboxylesterase